MGGEVPGNGHEGGGVKVLRNCARMLIALMLGCVLTLAAMYIAMQAMHSLALIGAVFCVWFCWKGIGVAMKGVE